MRIETRLVRALAALLIVNSHLEGFYPKPFLAADGLLGDALFFVLSGLGLACGACKEPIRFTSWYGRRILRIYPSVLIVVFVAQFLIGQGWKNWTLAEYPNRFLWAESFGFIHQIMIFYAIFYLILRTPDTRLIGRLLTASFVPYSLVCFWPFDAEIYHRFHWLYYFQLMLFGAWLGVKPRRIGEPRSAVFVTLAGLFTLYLGVRFGVATGRLTGMAQLLPHLALFGVTYLMIRAFQSSWVTRNLLARPLIGPLTGMISGATLELYLVHYPFITCEPLLRLAFPWNITLLLVCSVTLALIVADISRRFRLRIEKHLPLIVASPIAQSTGPATT